MLTYIVDLKQPIFSNLQNFLLKGDKDVHDLLKFNVQFSYFFREKCDYKVIMWD